MHHLREAPLWHTQCTLVLSNNCISYTLSSSPVPVSSLGRSRRGEALGPLLGNYLWVKTIITYDTIKKAISSTTSACISLSHLRKSRIPLEQMIMLTKCPLLLFRLQNYLSSFNQTHCFLMGGHRALEWGGGGGHSWSHSWSQTRQVIIHQPAAENDLRQEAHSRPPLALPASA